MSKFWCIKFCMRNTHKGKVFFYRFRKEAEFHFSILIDFKDVGNIFNYADLIEFDDSVKSGAGRMVRRVNFFSGCGKISTGDRNGRFDTRSAP